MVMRYLPFTMRLYRASLCWEMERDLPGFAIEGGQTKVYVKQIAPKNIRTLSFQRQTQLCSQLGLRHNKRYSLWKSEVKKASV